MQRVELIEQARVAPLAAKNDLLSDVASPDDLALPRLEALVWAEIGLNDLARAESLLRQLNRRLLDEDAPTDVKVGVGYLEGVLRLAQGLPNRARATLEALDVDPTLDEDAAAAAKAMLAIISAEAGEDDRASEAYREAIESSRANDAYPVLCQLLNNRAVWHLSHGRFVEAAADLDEAEHFGPRVNLLWQAIVTHNRGSLTARLGDLPGALEHFRAASEHLSSGGPHVLGPALLDQGQLLLDAGLLDEADRVVEQAVQLFRSAAAPARELEALWLRMRVAGTTGAWSQAAEHCAVALRLAEANGLDGHTAGLRQTQEACELIERARSGDERLRSSEAERIVQGVDPAMALDAGLLLASAGHVSAAIVCLERSQHVDEADSALAALHDVVARAELARLKTDPSQAIDLAYRGLADTAFNEIALGVTEFRSLAHLRLDQLTNAGTAAALVAGRPVDAVRLIEAARAISLTAEPTTSNEQRSIVARIRSEVAERNRIAAVDQLRAESFRRQADLEAELRRTRRSQVHRAPVERRTTSERTSVSFFYLIQTHGRAYALVVHQDSDSSPLDPTVIDLGVAEPMTRAVSSLTLMLEIAADERVEWPIEDAVARLAATLGPVIEAMEGLESAVIVADPPFEAVPWSLLTTCPVSQAQSADQWRTISDTPPDLSGLTLVAGPSLTHSQSEVDRIASLVPGAIVIAGSDATTEAVIDALRRSTFVHFATHGRFRTDNALMSSLELVDGPLTFWDLLHELRVPPHIVFSACDVGRHAPQASLGLGAILFERGCRALVAARGPANDRATAAMMGSMYGELNEGVGLASALRRAQYAHPEEPSLAHFGSFGKS